MENQFSEFLSILGMCIAIIGVLFLLLLPRKLQEARLRATALFIGGVVLLTMNYLFQNPDFLQDIQENIALVAIGLVIATISVIKLLKK